MSLCIVAKPSDHKVLYKWVCELRCMNETKTLEFTDHKNVVQRYERANNLPLCGDPKTPEINYLDYVQTKSDKNIFHNSWATDRAIH